MKQQDPGVVGIWTWSFDRQPAPAVRDAAAEIEELGFGALWFGEGLGRDTVGQAWLLLSATRRIVVASGIANVALRDPISMATAERALGEAFPGRYLLGLGGHRVGGRPVDAGGFTIPSGGRPLALLSGYLDAMDAVPAHGPVPDPPVRRVLGALGPKMLALAAQRTWGAHPYFVPVEHTARAREVLGPDSFLGVEQPIVFDPDIARARELARAHVAAYASGAPHQAANLRRLGFGDDDLAGPSGRLVDAIVAYGDLNAIEERVRRHLSAGADHVCLQVVGTAPAALPLREWRELSAIVPSVSHRTSVS
ncbi:TIGR03620 family F420-dependent LLM class oxidoreductase [Nocardia testacea]|uniref:TIGR03620 family F420-dependent LLM class oxidoreductase n=1 Tax=Nocardia testacea TaxID=248551 RepID=UPI0003100A9F|nr:TIGR03620 family F420-dependent LLM class oxidoreductase [Nocardia testacea]